MAVVVGASSGVLPLCDRILGRPLRDLGLSHRKGRSRQLQPQHRETLTGSLGHPGPEGVISSGDPGLHHWLCACLCLPGG